MELTYLDGTRGSRRFFTLGDESLVVASSSWMGASFRQEFALAKIKAVPDEHRFRDDSQAARLALPGLVLFLLGVGFGTSIYERTPFWFYAILVSGVAGIFGAYLFVGKVRVYLFKSVHEAPLFAIGERGRHTAEFEAFTEELQKRIRAAVDRQRIEAP
jgi:hypothetical protein